MSLRGGLVANALWRARAEPVSHTCGSSGDSPSQWILVLQNFKFLWLDFPVDF